MKKIICFILTLCIIFLATANINFFQAEALENPLKEDLTFDESWFEKDSAVYNHDLCRYASKLVTESNRNIILTVLGMMHFYGAQANVNYYADNTSRDEQNFFIAHYDINVNSKNYKAVIVCLSGSIGLQWNSNFDPYGIEREKNYAGEGEKGTTHLGFADARDFVYSYLERYIRDFCTQSEVKLLITGHSRGAAAANLLAAKIIDEGQISSVPIAKENVYSYTFATPNNTKSPDRFSPKFDRIFNIINPEDMITKLIPAAWGFGKYGTTYSLPSRTNCEVVSYTYEYAAQMKQQRLKYSEDDYTNYAQGEEPTDRIVKSMTDNVENTDTFYSKNLQGNKQYIMTAFQFFRDYFCPFVNGTLDDNARSQLISTIAQMISDSDEGSMIHSFIMFIIQYELAATCFSNAHEAATYYAYVMTLPESVLKNDKESFVIKLYGVDSIEVSEISSGIVVGKVSGGVRDKKINSQAYSSFVSVEKDCIYLRLPINGKYYIKTTPKSYVKADCVAEKISSSLSRLSRTNIFDIELSPERSGKFVSENGQVYFAYNDSTNTIFGNTMNEGSIPNAEITCNVKGLGIADSKVVGAIGNIVNMTATPDKNNYFIGWYRGEELISDNTVLSYLVKSDETIKAVFTNNYYNLKDNCSTRGNIIYNIDQGCSDISKYIDYEGFKIDCSGDDDILGTGEQLTISLNGQEIDTYTISVAGDINGDGFVDSFDVSIMSAITNYEFEVAADTAMMMSCDLLLDGYIDSFDLVTIVQISNFE